MNATHLLAHEEKNGSSRPDWLQQSWLEPRLVAITALAIVLSLLGERFEWPALLILLLDLTAYAAGGYYGLKAALSSLLKRRIDVDLLMILAAVGAATINQWHEGAILLFLFSLSNVLQDYAIGRSRSAIQSLFKLYPEEATIRRDNEEKRVSLDQIQMGDVVLIRPAERIPVDGIIVEGRSAVDESPITGESMPVDKTVGDQVFAGSLNQQGLLDVRTTRLAGQSTLARIIKLVEEAQENQAPTERFLDIFEQRYALFILVSVALFIIIPPALGLVEFSENFYRAMVLMTVASPCALVISVPAAFISAIASAARGGVLFKGGAYLEQLAGVRALAFDKTGTLTLGKPKVTDIVPAEGQDRKGLLRLAASVEARSEHPLADAIVREAQAEDLDLLPLTSFEALVGQGIRAELDGKLIQMGSLRYLEQVSPITPALATDALEMENDGKTVIGVIRDSQTWLGVIAIADQVRDDAAAVVAGLHARGLTVAMLTGDNERVAMAIAEQTGIDRVHAGLMPEDKVRIIKELQAEFGSVAMIGDGVNDAPALATADVGIAMGAAGTDVALETADIVLMADRIDKIEAAIDLSRKARRVVWQNISFSLGVIVVLVMGAFLIDLPLPLGVLGHEGSTVIVVLNGLISLLVLPEISRRRNAKSNLSPVKQVAA